MSDTALAVVAALGASSLFAVASALQHQEANVVEKGSGVGLLVSLVKRPVWLIGIVSDIGAVTLQAIALGLGSVALVQVLLVAGLPLATLLSAVLQHRRLYRFEILGLALFTPGIALLAPAISSTPNSHNPSRVSAAIAAAIIAAVALPLLANRHRPRFGGLYAGLAAGLVLGSASVVLAVSANRAGNLSALFGSIAPYLAALVGLLGLLLSQIAFQTGELGLPLAALSLTEPVIAVLLATTVLRESLPSSGLSLTAAILGSILAVAGVLALCREPAAVHVPV